MTSGLALAAKALLLSLDLPPPLQTTGGRTAAGLSLQILAPHLQGLVRHPTARR